jgi:prephenate dehydrogenase
VELAFNFHRPSSLLYPPVVRFRKITILGVGLLGGSIGLAVRKRCLADEVAGYVRRERSVVECEKSGATDYATTDLLAAVSNADVVILCTPLAQMRSLVQQFLPALKRGAIVTDVGSVKASLVRDVEALIQKCGAHFIGSHPMAGSEKAGVMAARPGLFEQAACVVTPTKKSNRSALRTVGQFWKSLGGRVLRMTPEVHDQLISRSSHLPHISAAVLASLVLNPAFPKEQSKLCATGFRDTTRIASGSPEMWRDIGLANRNNLIRAIDVFVKDLHSVQRALKNSDAEALARFFERAKKRRDAWCAGCASPSQE